MRFLHLAICVVQQNRVTAMQYTGGAGGQRGGVFTQSRTTAAGFHADQLGAGIRQQRVKQTDCIRTATHTGHRNIREAAGKLRVEGRDYVMRESDVAHFLISK